MQEVGEQHKITENGSGKELEKLSRQLEEKDEQLRIKDDEIFKLRAHLAYLIRQKFGTKSEQYKDADQLSLFQMQEMLTRAELPGQDQETLPAKPPRKKPGRKALPKDLPRKTEVIEPDFIPEGARKIGEDITEKLEYTPGQLWVRQIIRPKYACPKSETIITGELPDFAIEKGLAGASLIAHFVVSKFVDHIPFYRTICIFKRTKVTLAEGTVNNWFAKVALLLAPLYEKLKKQTLASNYIQADETTIKVQLAAKKGSTHQGYYWVYYSPGTGALFFEYDPGRAQTVPQKTLADYTGTLQTDGYQGYEALPRKDKIKRLACMAHARRYFEKAKDEDPDRVNYILSQIQRLYAIERTVAELDNTQRYQIRQKQAVPILNKIKEWTDEQRNKVLPRSLLGGALVYMGNAWDRLVAYTDSGEYLIDNNPIENKIRPIALGRKNYLFAGSPEGAKRGAIIYSLMAACKINDVDPYQWLVDILDKLPSCKSSQLEELLPKNWKAATSENKG